MVQANSMPLETSVINSEDCLKKVPLFKGGKEIGRTQS